MAPGRPARSSPDSRPGSSMARGRLMGSATYTLDTCLSTCSTDSWSPSREVMKSGVLGPACPRWLCTTTSPTEVSLRLTASAFRGPSP
jgi:hypothetical protein